MLKSENYSNMVVKDVEKTMKESISSEMKVAQDINIEFNQWTGKSLGGSFPKIRHCFKFQ